MTDFDISVLDTVPVLKTLSKTWFYISSFKDDCYSFSNPETLLSLFSTLSEISDFDNLDVYSKAGKLRELALPDADSDIKLLKLFWGSELCANIFSAILTHVEGRQIKIDALFDVELTAVKALDLDPVLKVLLTYKLLCPFFTAYKHKRRIDRLVFIFLCGQFSLLKTPVVYPDYFSDIDLTGPLNEDLAIQFLKRFSGACLSGSLSLRFAKTYIETLTEKLLAVPEFAKLANPQFFRAAFSKLYVTIPQIMQELNWKRDKAARVLAVLSVSHEYFIEEKIGRDKLFINAALLTFLKEVNLSDILTEINQR